jgi:hypothetical protein
VCHPRLGLTKKCFPSTIRRRLQTRKRRGGGGKNTCNNHSSERCLLQQADIPDSEKEQLAKKYLRPARPSAWANDPDQWLDSNNIADVMKQYEEAYPDFKFLGVMPIDFAAPDPYDGKGCLVDKICQLDLSALKKSGTWKLGVIFNLDPHYKDGSHWVGSFVDLKKKKVYYFDSYGMKPPEQIAKFMRSLTVQDPELELEYNARRFQYQGSECGMYSMYFIISMLEGSNYKDFCHHSIPDKEMLRMRHLFFS